MLLFQWFSLNLSHWGRRHIALILSVKNCWYEQDHSVLSAWKLSVCNICVPQADTNAFVPVWEEILKEIISQSSSRMNSSFFPWDTVTESCFKVPQIYVCPGIFSLRSSFFTSGSVQSSLILVSSDIRQDPSPKSCLQPRVQPAFWLFKVHTGLFFLCSASICN